VLPVFDQILRKSRIGHESGIANASDTLKKYLTNVVSSDTTMERTSSSEEINQAVSDAAMISSARTTKSTKDQYGRKMVHAVSWFKDRHPQVVRGNDILYDSLLPEHLPEFFASIA
jgi:hypothetical protein